jgi:hypothetical protein
MIIDPREPVTAAALAVDPAAFYNPTDPVLLAWMKYIIADDAHDPAGADAAMDKFSTAMPTTAAGQAAALQSVANMLNGNIVDEDQGADLAKRLQDVIDSVAQTTRRPTAA